jgi:hypothetical protein
VIITINPKTEGAGAEPLEVLTLTVNLLPASARPMPEPLAHWTQTESACCIFHYLTGTAAERDIATITTVADESFEQVEAQLDVTRQTKVVFTLLSRLLGHGGFASDEISLTYIDRDAAHSDLISVFKHEGTHILDRQISRERPVIMTEGMAVYVAGGHFKPEDLEKRAAALLILEDYIPLTELADDFYFSQHELGYLEGGAFIQFLVDTFGWESVKSFYGSFQPAPTDSAMLDGALRANFNQSLAELESEWLAKLSSLPPDFAQVEDLRLTVMLYDTLRRYQQANDPAASLKSAVSKALVDIGKTQQDLVLSAVCDFINRNHERLRTIARQHTIDDPLIRVDDTLQPLIEFVLMSWQPNVDASGRIVADEPPSATLQSKRG